MIGITLRELLTEMRDEIRALRCVVDSVARDQALSVERWRDSEFPSLLSLMSTQVRARNMIFAEVLGARGIPVADIYDLSLEAAYDRSLVAEDNLHPSGRQYTLWLDRIVPVVRELLEL